MQEPSGTALISLDLRNALFVMVSASPPFNAKQGCTLPPSSTPAAFRAQPQTQSNRVKSTKRPAVQDARAPFAISLRCSFIPIEDMQINTVRPTPSASSRSTAAADKQQHSSHTRITLTFTWDSIGWMRWTQLQPGSLHAVFNTG